MVMRKVTRAQLRSITMKLAKEQGGNCLLCGEPLDFSIKGAKGDSVVCDHDHITGRIRGALHRSCNGGEGKVASACGRWIVGSMGSSAAIANALRNMADYLEREPTDFIYPTHKTEEEKRLAANAKARKARATRKAAQEIKK
ncbi:endonuclease [Escherichia phage vB_EcoP_PAS7]|uniref:Endonuclease n=1 Tax=Escherichia phage vB_EcoP_PAS7 TaxID=3053875 RepID=A0AA51Z2S2_9CAUD|nr:endonuclease [Escherichia phage vB_EcoP_PAS7]